MRDLGTSDMRLRLYLNEGYQESITTDTDRMVEVIKKDCKEYLKALKGNKPFLRYTQKGIPHDTLLLSDTMKSRESKGSLPGDMKHVNAYLRTNGHYGRDKNVVFAGGSGYGNIVMNSNPFWIFPMDPLKYTWGEFNDFNINSEGWDSDNSAIIGKFLNNDIEGAIYLLTWENNIDKIITTKERKILVDVRLLGFNSKKVNKNQGLFTNMLMKFQKYFISKFHTNEGILTALQKDYEIWFKCSSYYSLSPYGPEVKNNKVIERILE